MENPDEQPHFDMQKLNKYIKFYVKIITKGNAVENKVLRSNMVECTPDMFENLPEKKRDLSKLTRRLCPDMKNLKG